MRPVCLMIAAGAALVGQERGQWLREWWFEPGMEHANPMPNARFRVNSPEVVLHKDFGKRSETFMSGAMNIRVQEDLRELEGAELYAELWGGHPATSRKRVTMNGRSTYSIAEGGTSAKHCTHQYPELTLKVTDLLNGYNAVQWSCEQGDSFWGHFIVENASIRAVLKPEHADLQAAGLAGCDFTVKARPGADEKVALSVESTPACLNKVARVDYQAAYEGYAENGSGGAGWHGFTKAKQPVGYAAVATAAPWLAEWSTRWVPDQKRAAVRAWIRFAGLPRMVYRTAALEGVSMPERRGAVRLYGLSETPKPFWSRANRKVTAKILMDGDPAQMESARLFVVAWDGGAGAVKEPFTLNGAPLNVIENGKHDVLYREIDVDPQSLKQGENVVELLSDTEHHGIEILRPGPALIVRYKIGQTPQEKLQVTLQDGVMHQGQESLKITTPRATYVYHKEGGGFASVFDKDGNDWLSYRPGGGSAGEFRGIPNLGTFGHPGYEGAKGCTTKVLETSARRVVFESESRDAKWKWRWEITPELATMTMLRAGGAYWFLYEGTPGGKLELDNDWWMTSSGKKRRMDETWNDDLPGPEWVAFVDEKLGRALWVSQRADDGANDQFWQMEGNMTVWGFGRQYRCCGMYLTKAPAVFSFGIAESKEAGVIAAEAEGISR